MIDSAPAGGAFEARGVPGRGSARSPAKSKQAVAKKKISAAKADKNVSTKGGVQKKKVAVSKRKSAV